MHFVCYVSYILYFYNKFSQRKKCYLKNHKRKYIYYLLSGSSIIKVFILVVFTLSRPRRRKRRKRGVGLAVSGVAEAEENPRISRSMQFKPMLFKGQLYMKFLPLKCDIFPQLPASLHLLPPLLWASWPLETTLPGIPSPVSCFSSASPMLLKLHLTGRSASSTNLSPLHTQPFPVATQTSFPARHSQPLTKWPQTFPAWPGPFPCWNLAC